MELDGNGTTLPMFSPYCWKKEDVICFSCSKPVPTLKKIKLLIILIYNTFTVKRDKQVFTT